MQDILVFRIYAPLASWGQEAVGGVRPTGLFPTRSALLGLVGAALGIERDDEKRQANLQASFSFAVKQLTPTNLLRDYHTTQVPSQGKQHSWTRKMELGNTQKLNTILSSRDYRCDGIWIIAITLNKGSEYTLSELKKAMLFPKFQLYLGRKSCPLSLPTTPRIRNHVTLKEALDSDFPAITASAKQDAFLLGKRKMVTYFWEGDKNRLAENIEGVVLTQPWDEPLSRKRWQFKQRKQYQWSQMENN